MQLNERIYPRYTPTEKRALHARMVAGDVEAKRQLVLCIVPFALDVSKRWTFTGDQDERVGVCMLGIVDAVETWSPECAALTTHARNRIAGQINRFVRSEKRFIRSRRRERKRRPECFAPAASAELEADDDARATVEFFRAAMKTLTPEQRVLIARRVAGMTQTTIGKSESVNPRSVAQMTRRAMNRLRAFIQQRESDQ